MMNDIINKPSSKLQRFPSLKSLKTHLPHKRAFSLPSPSSSVTFTSRSQKSASISSSSSATSEFDPEIIVRSPKGERTSIDLKNPPEFWEIQPRGVRELR